MICADGRGQLMLLLHGFPEGSFAWKKQIEHFSHAYYVVAPDLRGLYRIPDLIEHIHALIKQLGFERCILIGHDWGGMIGCCFAARYPDMVEKLIMICAAHPAILQRELQHNPAQQAASSYTLLLRDARAEKILSANHYDYLWHYLLSEITEKKLFSEEEIKEYETAWAQPNGLTGGLNYYRAWSAAEDFTQYHVSVPTLVIWGERDRALLPCLLDGLDEYVDDLTIKKIPDGSHWVIHEMPALINAYISAFIFKK